MPELLGVRLPPSLIRPLVVPLAAAGLAPFDIHLLTAIGRRTGRRYTTPVTVLRHDGARWLVAPYGERNWVKNARAAGWVDLRRGRRRERVRVEELPPEERPPVLRAYLRRVPANRDLFDAPRDAPLEAFAASAARQPVFRVLEG